MNAVSESIRDTTIPTHWDRSGLPAWCYRSESLLELEKKALFSTHWQLMCHVADIPNAGDYIAVDVGHERALIVHGDDGEIRAFHNMCQHRGSRLVSDNAGHCKSTLVCPFHGWTYALDGRLRGVAQPGSFPDITPGRFDLQPLQIELWCGFVFVRFAAGPQPSVAVLMASFEDELASYNLADVLPTEGIWTDESPVNWKTVRDVDNEGYHVARAHPTLQVLYGSTYADEPYINGASRSYAKCADRAVGWSPAHYLQVTQAPTHFPQHLRKAWIYYGLFPNCVIAVTPESVQFYQEFPLTPITTQLRGAVYRFAEETREQRVARYLAMRIDRITQREDIALTRWSSEAYDSSAFKGVYLSDLEYCVKSHHDHLRAVLPVCTLATEPGSDIMAVNASMLADSGSTS